MGVYVCSMVCCAVLCALSSFVIILMEKRVLSSRCLMTVIVMLLFLTAPCVGLQCVIVVFPNHRHLLFGVQM